MAIVKNQSGEDDLEKGWRTYYIEIRADGHFFYKFGVSNLPIKKRYAREPNNTSIRILNLWWHKTEAAALRHERLLFKTYPGDLPYVGKCGPLKKGGNTETYSHDVMNGESPPHSYVLKHETLYEGEWSVIAYSGENPLKMYRNQAEAYRFMDGAFELAQVTGEGSWVQVPHLSSESSVVIATMKYIERALEPNYPPFSKTGKKHYMDALDRGIVIRSWADYCLMDFLGKPSKRKR